MKALDALVSRWRSDKVELFPGRPAEEVVETFAKLGSIATPDVILLYSKIGGMKEMDEDYWRLWTLEEVVERNKAPSPFGILFSDYLIDCWDYRLKPEANNRSSVYVELFDGQDSRKLSDGLEEFFVAYISDRDAILS